MADVDELLERMATARKLLPEVHDYGCASTGEYPTFPCDCDDPPAGPRSRIAALLTVEADG